MASLAYQSKGTELDVPEIRVRLEAQKKVAVIVDGMEHEVEGLLRKLFGEIIVRSSRPIDAKNLRWQVDIVRDEKRHKMKKIDVMPENLDQEDEEKPIPKECLRYGFEEIPHVTQEVHTTVQKLLQAVKHNAYPHESAPIFSRALQMIHETTKQRYEDQSNRTGALAELVSAHYMKNVIESHALPLHPVMLQDLHNRGVSRRSAKKHVFPEEVMFYDFHSLQTVAEMDMLCETADEKAYVGFDFTIKKRKKNLQQKTQILAFVANSILKRPLVMIDAMLGLNEYEFHQPSPIIYRLHIPTAIDFTVLTEPD